jgi:hypothetical protein
MKKLVLSIVALLSLVGASNAQRVNLANAETLGKQPGYYHGQTVTVNNVVFKGISTTPGPNLTLQGPTAIVLTGAVAGRPKYLPCDIIPKSTLTKWKIGSNDDFCVQVSNTLLTQIKSLQPGDTIQSITIRCRPDGYGLTDIVK